MAKKPARKKSAAKAKVKVKIKTKPKTNAKKVARRPAKKAAPARARVRAQAQAQARKAAPESAPPGPPKLISPSVVHWEVQARDPVAQGQFFGSLFGWIVDVNNPQNYGMVTAGGPGSIGGGIGATMDGPRATFYVQVPSIVDTLDKAATMGAQMVMPRTDIGMVVMAQFRDPEGNLIGLIEG
jgi:predicted enzyme related to lactoylglutathione lyase